MRHRKKTVKLGRTSSHRKAMLSSMVCSLIKERRIKTTLPKARAAKSLAEKMVTLGKDGSLAARRRALAALVQKDHVPILFDEIAPGFSEREGGYTRILKLGKRTGDGAEMVLLEWVESGPVTPKTKKKAAPKSAAKKTAKKPAKKAAVKEAAPAEDAAAEEAPPEEAAEAEEATDKE